MTDFEPNHEAPKPSTSTDATPWRAGLFVLTYVSGWLLVPIVALFIGRWLDQRLDTWPWLAMSLSLGSLVAVSAGAVGYVKKVSK